MLGWLEYSKQNTFHSDTSEVYKYTYIFGHTYICKCHRQEDIRTSKLQNHKRLRTPLFLFSRNSDAYIQQSKQEKTLHSCQATDTSRCQTFHYTSHYTSHSDVLSFASPLVRQHCPFCQSSWLEHHPQDVLGEAGSRHARSTSSMARQSPFCLFPNVEPTLTMQGSSSSSSKWDFFLRLTLQLFFLLLRQRNFLCLGDPSVLVIQRSFSWAWCLAWQHHAECHGQAPSQGAQTSARNTYLSHGERTNVSFLL